MQMERLGGLGRGTATVESVLGVDFLGGDLKGGVDGGVGLREEKCFFKGAFL